MATRAVLYCSAAAALAAMSACFFASPHMPALKPLAVQMLYRLRDILAFLIVTAATAAAIFTTQRNKDSANPSLADPLSYIFSEADEYLQDLSSPMIDEKARKCEALEDRVVRTRDAEWDLGGAERVQQRKKLHRRASSLNDSVNYEPEPEQEKKVEEAEDQSVICSIESGVIDGAKGRRGVKDLDLAAISPSSLLRIWQNREAEEEALLCMSPDEINRQADAFIAKFKERMRLQRLDSFQRYRRKT